MKNQPNINISFNLKRTNIYYNTLKKLQDN